MVGAFKSVLIAIIAAVVLILVTQLVFFFPFYMTVVVETFNLANIAANDNYVKDTYFQDSLNGLKSRPLFNTNPSSVIIDIRNSDGDVAIGWDDEFSYNDHDGLSLPDGTLKPYRQRGEPVTVTVKAVYPLKMTISGVTIRRGVPVSFEITTIGLKYYKDLEL